MRVSGTGDYNAPNSRVIFRPCTTTRTIALMFNRVVHFLRPTFFALIVFAIVVGVANLVWLTRGDPPQLLSVGGLSASELRKLDLSRVLLPKASIPPEEVVRLQLAGLSDPKSDGVGVLQCYAFASPANRAITGPLDRFGKMVRQGAFQCMASPQVVLVGRPQKTDRIARVLVTLVDDEDRLHAFTFVLGRQQQSPFKDCWMTEAVLPSLPAAAPSPAAIPAV
jgi:hypothetical protein